MAEKASSLRSASVTFDLFSQTFCVSQATYEIWSLAGKAPCGLPANTNNEALAHAHLAHLARLSNDRETAACEADLARVLAKADPDQGYLARIEANLHAERWSDVQTG